jgi:hypothetical protein
MEKHLPVRSLWKLLKLVAINLVLLFALLEIVSLGFYFIQTRNFFCPIHKDLNKANATRFEVSEPDREPWTFDYQIHPYFGFVTPPSYAGFPFKKTNKDQFIIGIFGGSVAQEFCDYEFQHHVLAKLFRPLPEFQNKEIVLLKFANQAHKQPQQLLTMNYFLSVGQELDMVINIDGFNEVALSYLNNKAGTEVSMPNDYIFSPMIALANKDFSSEQLELSLEVLQLKNRLQNTINRLSECKLATCYMLRWSQAKYFLNRYREKAQRFSQLRKEAGKGSLVYLKRVEKSLGRSGSARENSRPWFNSSLGMNDLLAARKIPYFEFIQPNQYYSTNREFSADEKKIAFDDRSQYREGTIKGYPKLLTRISGLHAVGVKVFNAVNVFDETKDIVYRDNCCHYNDLGNDILSYYVGKSIVMVLNARPAPGLGPHPARLQERLSRESPFLSRASRLK